MRATKHTRGQKSPEPCCVRFSTVRSSGPTPLKTSTRAIRGWFFRDPVHRLFGDGLPVDLVSHLQMFLHPRLGQRLILVEDGFVDQPMLLLRDLLRFGHGVALG